jgi:hypothetical protein
VKQETKAKAKPSKATAAQLRQSTASWLSVTLYSSHVRNAQHGREVPDSRLHCVAFSRSVDVCGISRCRWAERESERRWKLGVPASGSRKGGSDDHRSPNWRCVRTGVLGRPAASRSVISAWAYRAARGPLSQRLPSTRTASLSSDVRSRSGRASRGLGRPERRGGHDGGRAARITSAIPRPPFAYRLVRRCSYRLAIASNPSG